MNEMDLEKAKKSLKQLKKDQATVRKSRVKGFDSSTVSGMFGNLRRSEEIRFHFELENAKSLVKEEEKKQIKVPYTNQELVWLGYKDKKDYIKQHLR